MVSSKPYAFEWTHCRARTCTQLLYIVVVLIALIQWAMLKMDHIFE